MPKICIILLPLFAACTGSAALDVQLALLFGDYAARRDELVPDCSDDSDAAADSLWYHYHPGRWACRYKISVERDAINAQMREKYGWGDWWIGVWVSRDDSVPLRLDARAVPLDEAPSK